MKIRRDPWEFELPCDFMKFYVFFLLARMSFPILSSQWSLTFFRILLTLPFWNGPWPHSKSSSSLGSLCAVYKSLSQHLLQCLGRISLFEQPEGKYCILLILISAVPVAVPGTWQIPSEHVLSELYGRKKSRFWIRSSGSVLLIIICVILMTFLWASDFFICEMRN